MPRIKIAIGAFAVAALFSAISVVPALAESWFVNGTKLANGATVAIANTAEVTESGALNVPSLGVKITCTGGTNKVLGLEKAYIQGPTLSVVESMVLEGCSEIQPTQCRIQTRIVTTPLYRLTHKIISFPGFFLLTHSITARALANLEFEGASCVFAGEKPVNGTVAFSVPSGEEEAVSHTAVGLGTTENNSLELGGDKAYIEKGAAEIKLASSAKWSFH
jgi:hypothetical protein